MYSSYLRIFLQAIRCAKKMMNGVRRIRFFIRNNYDAEWKDKYLIMIFEEWEFVWEKSVMKHEL